MMATAVHTGAAVGGGIVLGLLLSGVVIWAILAQRFRQSGIPMPRHFVFLRSRHWSAYDLLLVGVLVSSAVLFFSFLGHWLQHMAVEARLLHIVAALQNTLLQLLVGGILIRRMRVAGSTIRESFGSVDDSYSDGKQVIAQVITWYVALLPAIFFAALVSQFIFAHIGMEHSFQPILVFFSDTATPEWFRWWVVGVAVIVAPIIEEVFFRGVLLPVLLQKYRLWIPLIGSSMLFALVHGHLPSMLPLFVLGLGLGGAYLYTGNLLVPIGIHALFNGVSLLLVLLAGLPDAL